MRVASLTSLSAVITIVLLSALMFSGCVTHVRVQGLVKDRSTGAPVTGAMVQAGAAAGSSDHRGLYDLLVPVNRNPQVLNIQASGFHPTSEFRVFWPQSGNPAVIMNFDLVPDDERKRRPGGGDTKINVVTVPSATGK